MKCLVSFNGKLVLLILRLERVIIYLNLIMMKRKEFFQCFVIGFLQYDICELFSYII